MLTWIRKFDLKKAGWISASIGGINIVVHLLVIAGIIPYLWVNGGRTESLEALGTIFEKCVMGIVTIIGFCTDTRIAFEKRW